MIFKKYIALYNGDYTTTTKNNNSAYFYFSRQDNTDTTIVFVLFKLDNSSFAYFKIF